MFVQPAGHLPGRPAEAPAEVPCETLQLHGRILLAEDNPDHQRLISFILQEAGVEVVIAANGLAVYEQAVQAWSASSPFDLVLMDVRMPEVDGCEVTARLRKAGYTRPIIALTAYAMVGDREEFLAAGCNDYAAKPFTRSQLLHIVSRHLRQPAP
jgi:CheY-like chemotaxis protein